MNRKKLKNNMDLAMNVSTLAGLLLDSKILVLHEYMPDISEKMNGYLLNDYFDAVIAESVEAAESVQNVDFLVYDDPTPYRENILFLPELEEFDKSIICTNYDASARFSKLQKTFNGYNVNYLPSDDLPEKEPSLIKGINCGLCIKAPGVHLGLILGASKIFYTGAKGKI